MRRRHKNTKCKFLKKFPLITQSLLLRSDLTNMLVCIVPPLAIVCKNSMTPCVRICYEAHAMFHGQEQNINQEEHDWPAALIFAHPFFVYSLLHPLPIDKLANFNFCPAALVLRAEEQYCLNISHNQLPLSFHHPSSFLLLLILCFYIS